MRGFRAVLILALATGAECEIVEQQLVPVSYLGNPRDWAVALSPDGRFATFLNGFGFRVMDARTGASINEIREPTDWTRVAWAPDSSEFALREPNRISIWRPSDRSPLRTIPLQFPGTLHWSPSGDRIASVLPNSVDVLSAADGKLITRVEAGQDARVAAFAWNPDGLQFAIWDPRSAYIEIHDAATGVLQRRLEIGPRPVESGLRIHRATSVVQFIPAYNLAWSPLGILAAHRTEWDIHFLDARSGKVRAKCRQRALVSKLAWTAGGGSLIVFTPHQVRFVDPTTGAVQHAAETLQRMGPADYTPGTDTFAAITEDNTLSVWQGRAESPALRIPSPLLPERGIRLLPDRKRIVFCGDRAEIWDIASASRIAALPKSISESSVWSPDGSRLAVGYNSTVYIHDGQTGEYLRSLDHSSISSQTIVWSPDSKQILTGGHQPAIADVETGKVRWLSNVPSGTPLFPIWTPDSGPRVITPRISQNRYYYHAPVPSPDGSTFAASSRDKLVVFDITANSEVTELNRGGADPYAIAWSPDSRRLAYATESHRIAIWDRDSRTVVARYETSRSASVQALIWDEQLTVVTASGGAAIVWQATSASALPKP